MRTKVIVLFAGFILFITQMPGQTAIDSALNQRAEAYINYKTMFENVNGETRANMSLRIAKATEIIEMDNRLIDDFLTKEIERNNLLTANMGKLNLEIALSKKDAEVSKMILDERNYIMKILLIMLGIFSILFLIALILYIDRFIKHSKIRFELDNLWITLKEKSEAATDTGELQNLNAIVNQLKDENSRLKSDCSELIKKNEATATNLQKEIDSKKLMEEEIKKLISQIKNI